MRAILRFAAAAFAVTFAVLWYASAPSAKDGMRPSGPHDGADWRRPGVYIEPEIDLNLNRLQKTPPGPETIPAALSECGSAGEVLIVDCLMGRYSSVSIRRLEACLGTETLPVDEHAVRACLAQGHW